MQSTLTDFDSATSAYRQGAFNTMIELYRWWDEQPTEPIRQYWGPAFANLDAALFGLEATFPELKSAVSDIRAVAHELFEILDSLIDARLDRITTLHHRSSPPSPEEEWRALAPIPLATLSKQRRGIRHLLEKMEKLQRVVAATVARDLSQPASDICHRVREEQ